MNSPEPKVQGLDVDLGTIENSGAMILLGRVLKDHRDLRVRIVYQQAIQTAGGEHGGNFAVEFADLTEPILCETAPVLRHALLAALSRLVDDWLSGRPRS